MSEIRKTRELYLWCSSVIYLFAFTSLYIQIPGLYGHRGILPVKVKEASSWLDFISEQPGLLRLMHYIGLNPEQGMDLLCLTGVLVSFICMVSNSHRHFFGFLVLWMLYFSLYQVGQTFMWFQWDILLLEMGFLTLLVAPFKMTSVFLTVPATPHRGRVSMWLLRWLLFRLTFDSGIVKLQSHCPTWWDLTALTYHYETQCIPTPLAWYAHQLPVWFQKLSVVATYVILMPISFLYFAPTRNLRMFAFFAQMLLQVLIFLTGNYNFFNLMTMVLCLSLLDDAALYGNVHGVPSTSKGIWSRLRWMVPVAVICFLAYKVIMLFNITVTPQLTVESEIGFSKDDFDKWVHTAMSISIFVGIVSLTYEVILAIKRCFCESKTVFQRGWSVFVCGMYSLAAFGMFSISLIPHTRIEQNVHQSVMKHMPSLYRLYENSQNFHITNSYGLFRRMTGVGGRPEIVIQGSYDMETWMTYEFLYKPGNVSRMPPFVAPHQPRLDWQMWFAALGSYHHNPWFLNLIYRLFENQPEVVALLDINPFRDKPPKYLKATLYHYAFTRMNTASQSFLFGGDWWTRKLVEEYIPPITRHDPGLLNYLEHNNILHDEELPDVRKAKLSSLLSWVRGAIGPRDGFKLSISLFLTGSMVSYFM